MSQDMISRRKICCSLLNIALCPLQNKTIIQDWVVSEQVDSIVFDGRRT